MARGAAVVCLPFLIALSLAVRTRKTETSLSPKRVDKLVTWGAPRTGTADLRNNAESGFCFNGVRFVNQDSDFLSCVDIVPSLTVPGYDWGHPLMPAEKVDENYKGLSESCGESRTRTRVPCIEEHYQSFYWDRLKDFPREKDVNRNALRQSYMPDASEVEESLEPGWHLAATDDFKSDILHVVKQDSTGECIITFSGSNDFQDWFSNIDLEQVDYCQLGDNRVHSGFLEELRAVLERRVYQNTVKSVLKSCSKVTAAGHSLGGAMAALFTACANNGNAANGDADFELLKWW